MSEVQKVEEKIVYVDRPAKKGKGLWWKIPLIFVKAPAAGRPGN